MHACRIPVRARTDRCPGVLLLHEAADGRLARVRLPGGRVDAAGLRAVADVAACGNGIVELTVRASLQLRGLQADAGPAVAAALRAGGLLPSADHDRVRNVLASPVAGRHPCSSASTDDVVKSLDRGLCADPALRALPGRFLFAIDDGSATVDVRQADVALTALSDGTLRLWIGGRATTIAVACSDAPEVALHVARAFLRLGGEAWRVRDLNGATARIAQTLGGQLRDDEPRASREIGIGALEQADGRVAITVLPPLGRLDGEGLRRLAALTGEVRLSASRTLTVVDVARDDATRLTAELSGLGLVTTPGSGWQGLSACAGLGACAGARVDVRAAATARAQVRTPDAPAEHWSACERRCGRPRDTALSIAATGDGLAVGDDLAIDVSAALALLAEARP